MTAVMNPIREQLQTMLRVVPRENGFRAHFDVRADLSIFPDHFRDAPILPAICMVLAILLAGAAALGVSELELRVLKNAKMRQPIVPGDQIVIDADWVNHPDGDVALKAIFTGDGQRRAEFSLIVRPISNVEIAHR